MRVTRVGACADHPRTSVCLALLLSVPILFSAFNADARRALRVEGEFSSTWEAASGCTGTSDSVLGPVRGDTGVNLSGTVFIGRNDIQTAIDSCEITVQYVDDNTDYFSNFDFEVEDDFGGGDPDSLSN